VETSTTPPAPWLALVEPIRAAAELGALFASLPALSNAPRGDGHPVLVLPGYAASDASTWVLREFLSGIGYRAFPWGLGRNQGGLKGDLGSRLALRLDDIAQQADSPVSLVGWSLGGVYARVLAKRFPTKVRQVITLGSPFAGSPTATSLYRVYQQTGHPRAETIRTAPRDAFAGEPLTGIPSTAIYSRSDGVVAWQIAREQPGPLSENIEVVSSHVGLGIHPAVLYAVADRLAEDPNHWQAFSRAGWRRLVYPSPEPTPDPTPDAAQG
jgi:pimeloyl-ACP methyl ester carboxylesterase